MGTCCHHSEFVVFPVTLIYMDYFVCRRWSERLHRHLVCQHSGTNHGLQVVTYFLSKLSLIILLHISYTQLWVSKCLSFDSVTDSNIAGSGKLYNSK